MLNEHTQAERCRMSDMYHYCDLATKYVTVTFKIFEACRSKKIVVGQDFAACYSEKRKTKHV